MGAVDWGQDDTDMEIEKCMGCGHYYGEHAGLLAWDSREEGSVAPQLCARCWRDGGYTWPARFDQSEPSAKDGGAP